MKGGAAIGFQPIRRRPRDFSGLRPSIRRALAFCSRRLIRFSKNAPFPIRRASMNLTISALCTSPSNHKHVYFLVLQKTKPVEESEFTKNYTKIILKFNTLNMVFNNSPDRHTKKAANAEIGLPLYKRLDTATIDDDGDQFIFPICGRI